MFGWGKKDHKTPPDTYTPIAVLKAFTKMALSILPEAELPNFQAALSWVRNSRCEGPAIDAVS